MTSRWRQCQLGDVCTIEKVQGQHRNLPYVGLEHIEANTGRFIGSLKPEEVKSTTFKFSAEHLLYGRLRPYLNKVLAPDFEGHCSTEIFPLKPSAKVMRSYLQYWLQTKQTVTQIDATCTGARMPRANMSEVMELSFPLPPLTEQRRLVAIMDEAFAGLEALRANAEKNLQNARELFEGYLSSIFSTDSKTWQHKCLREVAKDFGRGKSKHRPRNDPRLYGGPYPFVQTGDVRNSNHLITSYTQTYNDVGLAQSKLWPKGTLCITIAANIAETGVLNFDACFPDSVIGFVADEDVTSGKFVEYLLQSFKAQLQQEGKGSAQDNINLGTFEDKLFPFPDLATQEKLVHQLDNLNADCGRLIYIYEKKLASIDELKQSILQRAFSGELTSSEAIAA